MTSQTHPNTPLTYDWDIGESYKAGMDANLVQLGALIQLSVLSRTSNQPSNPAEGHRYIHNGDTSWSVGSADDVLLYIDGGWMAYTPPKGWWAYVEDEQARYGYDGGWSIVSNPQANDSATSDPTASDDADAGYAPGSRWHNTNSGELFRCVDASPGNAVWLKTTLTLDELGTAATADQGPGNGLDADTVDGVHEADIEERSFILALLF